MEYIYNFTLNNALEISEATLIKICDAALKKAKLKAPIKTGNLRKSIKYKIIDYDVMLYVDLTMFKVPYYEYVDIAPKKDGSPRKGNGYWLNVVAEFGTILYANERKQFEIKLKAEQDEKKRQEDIIKRNEQRKKREEENKKKTDFLKTLAFLALLQKIGENNERKKQ